MKFKKGAVKTYNRRGWWPDFWSVETMFFQDGTRIWFVMNKETGEEVSPNFPDEGAAIEWADANAAKAKS